MPDSPPKDPRHRRSLPPDSGLSETTNSPAVRMRSATPSRAPQAASGTHAAGTRPRDPSPEPFELPAVAPDVGLPVVLPPQEPVAPVLVLRPSPSEPAASALVAGPSTSGPIAPVPVPVIDLEAPEHDESFRAALAEADAARRGRKRKRPNRPSQRARAAAAQARGEQLAHPRDVTPPYRSTHRHPRPLTVSTVTSGSQPGATGGSGGGAAVRSTALPPGVSGGVPEGSTGSRARRTAAARRRGEVDLPPREPPTTSQYTAWPRVGETALTNMVPIPFVDNNRREEMQMRSSRAPPFINLADETGHDSPWRLLRADRQEVPLLYYDLERPVTAHSATVVVSFLDLDIFLIHLYCRLRRRDWTRPDTDTLISLSHDRHRYTSWLAWFEQELNGTSIIMGYTEDDFKRDPRKRKDQEKTLAFLLLWQELDYVAACQYVLRRAMHERPFREALLRLPDSRYTRLLAASSVMGHRYAAVLREVAERLRGGCRFPAGGLPRDLLLGDSHIATLNFRPMQGGPVPGSIAHFRVLGFPGIDIRALCWITQAVVGPGTRWVAWVVGANNMELVPPPNLDDRTQAERQLAPRRDDRSGRIIPSWFANVPFELVYYARMLRALVPNIRDFFLAEIPPRYDHLGSHHAVPSDWVPLHPHRRNVEILRANLLLRNLLAHEPGIHVLQLYDRLNDPEYYWRGHAYNQHPNRGQLARRLYYLLYELQTQGVRACQRLQGYVCPGQLPHD